MTDTPSGSTRFGSSHDPHRSLNRQDFSPERARSGNGLQTSAKPSPPGARLVGGSAQPDSHAQGVGNLAYDQYTHASRCTTGSPSASGVKLLDDFASSTTSAGNTFASSSRSSTTLAWFSDPRNQWNTAIDRSREVGLAPHRRVSASRAYFSVERRDSNQHRRIPLTVGCPVALPARRAAYRATVYG
jgi:hypothetical protein